MMHSTAARPNAIMAVVMRGEHVLVVQRGPDVPGSGYWAPVSGKLEPGEEQAAAVVREVREEVGLHVRPLRRVWGCVSDARTYYLHWWLAEYVRGDLALDPREVSDARWILPAAYGQLENTFEGDRQFFARVFPGLLEKRPSEAGS